VSTTVLAGFASKAVGIIGAEWAKPATISTTVLAVPRAARRAAHAAPVAYAFLACAACAAPVGCADEEIDRADAPELVEPTALHDTDPDPDVVEVWLEAAVGTFDYLPGKPAEVWAYRDGATGGPLQVPGPLIEAKRGDLLRVHLTNELLEEGTTLHMHGLRLPAAMDGAHGAVLPKERFDYEFIAQDIGAFFYHPHLFSDVQIERGLHGPMLVRPDSAPRSPSERILVLDDVKLGPDGDLAGDWTEEDIAHGRRGNLLVVNGRPSPTLRAPAGARERWHLVNASNGRSFMLAIDGHPIDVIGWDSGPVAMPYSTESLVIAPGERYDVLVDLGGSAGEELDVRALPYDRGHGPEESEEVLFRVALDGRPPEDASPSSFDAIEPLPVTAATQARSFVLTQDVHGKYGPQFFINGELWPFNTPIEGSLGALEVWDVENQSDGDHPFHVHGMRFQVLSQGGVAVCRVRCALNIAFFLKVLHQFAH